MQRARWWPAGHVEAAALTAAPPLAQAPIPASGDESLVGAMRSIYSLALRTLLFAGVALPALAAAPQPLPFEAA